MNYTKKDHAESLNELEAPFSDLRSNGGRIPDNAKYGDWMRRHDPISFNIDYQEKRREHEYREDARARYLYNVSQGERTL